MRRRRGGGPSKEAWVAYSITETEDAEDADAADMRIWTPFAP